MAWAELQPGEYPKLVCEKCRSVLESSNTPVKKEYTICNVCLNQ